jgi:hypothetical protein
MGSFSSTDDLQNEHPIASKGKKMRRKSVWFQSILITIALFSFLALPGHVFSDGTETLGLPGIDISQGTGIVAAGTGLVDSQPASFNIQVPDGATVNMVLLYWEGQMSTEEIGDDTIVINGTEVEGQLIGGPAFFFEGAHCSSFRADITDLGLVGPGSNTLTIEGVDFTKASNGAGVVAIYDDGSDLADIQVLDGIDLAYINAEEPRQTTVAQTFTFEPADYDRSADLAMFFSSVAGKISSGDDLRPSVIEITVTGDMEEEGTTIVNELGSNDGEEWDTLSITIDIPAGASDVTVQAKSEDAFDLGALPASLAWVGSFFALSEPPAEPPPPPAPPVPTDKICFNIYKATAANYFGTILDWLTIKGNICLPDGAAPFNPHTDEVTLTMWDNTIRIPAGSFKTINHFGYKVYCYRRPISCLGRIYVYLDFNKGFWKVCTWGQNGSLYTNSSGGTVEMTVGDHVGTDSFKWTRNRSFCFKRYAWFVDRN